MGLYFFNKKERDIWCKDDLQEICQRDKRFQLQNILSDADDSWEGGRGRVSRDLITAVANPFTKEHATFIGVCGPPTFNRQVVEFFKEVDFPANSLHIFQG